MLDMLNKKQNRDNKDTNIQINYKEASKKDLEKAKLIELHYKYSPHVVILGAGASKANILNGDKNGLKVPCMNDFLEIGEFKNLLHDVHLKTKSKNLEDIYSEIYNRSLKSKKYEKLKNNIEECIRNYFCRLKIPDEPTIYDYLIMSLTDKDLIASFNWDPLLVQSYLRVAKLFNGFDHLPKIAFLHGNVGVEVDIINKRINIKTSPYADCYPGFVNSKLLFPIKKKNYSADPFIKNQWDMVKDYIGRAYMITIFGYGAPVSDIEAIKMLKNAWGGIDEKWANEIEIINIEDEDISYSKWQSFIYHTNYQCYKDFFDSFIAKHPRRTTESLFDVTMNVLWGKPSEVLNSKPSILDFYEHLSPLIDDEILKADRTEVRTNIYSMVVTPKHN